MKRTVRNIRRISAILLAACMVLAYCIPASAAAAGDEPVSKREYKVRVFSGQRGLIDLNGGVGQEMIEQIVTDGDRFDFRAQARVTATDDKYYVKGIRESGKDFKEDENAVSAEASPSFVVHQDIDFVVSYGIKGSSVAYTVNYLDGDGNELLPSETYYGNVGDQPVVAYQYIEGWLPQAYNLTRTLSENEAENVFDFIYTRVEPGTVIQPAPGGGGAAAGAGAGAGEAGAGDEGAGAGAGAGGDAVAGAGDNVDIADEAAPQDEGPQDLVNLDDEKTPLANFADGVKNILNPESDGVLVKVARPIAGVALAALLLGLFFLYRRKKKEKEETEANG